MKFLFCKQTFNAQIFQNNIILELIIEMRHSFNNILAIFKRYLKEIKIYVYLKYCNCFIFLQKN